MDGITAILGVIVEYASIWAPSVVAIIGILVSVISALAKVNTAIENFKQDKVVDDLRSEVKAAKEELKETNRQNALLLEQLSNIKGYSEAKKKEGERK